MAQVLRFRLGGDYHYGILVKSNAKSVWVMCGGDLIKRHWIKHDVKVAVRAKRRS